MRTSYIAILLFYLLSLPALSFPIQAEPFVEFGLGYSDVTLDQYQGGLALGFSAAQRVDEQFSLGLGIQSFSQELRNGSVLILPVFLDQRFHFNNFYIGPRLGVAAERARVDVDRKSRNETIVFLGAGLGYRHAISPAQDIGLNVSYLRLNGYPNPYEFYSLLFTYAFTFLPASQSN